MLTTKIPEKRVCGNKKHSNPPCPHCAWTVVWKHASYIRTGTHARELKNPPDTEIVTRCICKSPVCGRSFGILPPSTLPYCRFKFDDFLSISLRHQAGESAYAIWKSWSNSTVSLKTIKRLCILIEDVLVFVAVWTSEAEHKVTGVLADMCSSLLGIVPWFRFTTRWYHSIYPSRIWPYVNPQNLVP